MPSITEVMSRDPVVVEAQTSTKECAKLMERHGIGAVGVQRDGRIEGILTDRDIVLRAVAQDRDPREIPAGELASHDLVTAPPDCSVDEAEKLMRERGVRRLFVVRDGGSAVGILTADDLAARRDPGSVEAQQIDEAGLLRGDQGHTGQFE